MTAVSPTYAHEITTPEYGYGMETLLAQRMREGRLSGVLNGVDPAIWDPSHDLLLSSRYNRDTLEAKAENKRQLQVAMGLKVDDKAPVFAVISRLTRQKGLDLVLEALPGLLAQGGQLVLLGQGDAELQQGFLAAAAEHPGSVGVQIGYHEAFSHRIVGGADVIMVPSSLRALWSDTALRTEIWHPAISASHGRPGRYGKRQFAGKPGGWYCQWIQF